MVTNVEGTNAAISVTLVGVPDRRHKIQQVTWSYSDDPTSGALSSAGLQGDEWKVYITRGGPGPVALPPAAYGTVGGNVTFTLAAGGSGVNGTLNVFSEVE